jgi:hypothetical protein
MHNFAGWIVSCNLFVLRVSVVQCRTRIVVVPISWWIASILLLYVASCYMLQAVICCKLLYVASCFSGFSLLQSCMYSIRVVTTVHVLHAVSNLKDRWKLLKQFIFKWKQFFRFWFTSVAVHDHDHEILSTWNRSRHLLLL